MKKALHVGCSTLTLEHAPKYFHSNEWVEVRYDIDPSVKPDIIGSITDMHAVATGSMDAIYSSHNLEHVFPHEVDRVLKEFFRALKSNGLCIVAVPDLLQIAPLIAEDKLEDMAYLSPAGPITPLDMLYGLRTAIERGQHYMAHKTGFTPKTLGNYFLNAGFKWVEYFQSNFALTVIAYPEVPEKKRLAQDKKLIFSI
jgi:protein O-GlcNAc transferase